VGRSVVRFACLKELVLSWLVLCVEIRGLFTTETNYHLL